MYMSLSVIGYEYNIDLDGWTHVQTELHVHVYALLATNTT